MLKACHFDRSESRLVGTNVAEKSGLSAALPDFSTSAALQPTLEMTLLESIIGYKKQARSQRGDYYVEFILSN